MSDDVRSSRRARHRRRCACGAVVFVAAMALVGCDTATAPANSLFYDSNRTGNYEVQRAGAPGAAPIRLTNDPGRDSWWPRLSPDRRKVLFYRTPAGVHDTDFTKTSLWVMNIDGSAPTELRPPGTDGWVLQGHAEWSPTGTEIVMFGGSGSNPQIHVTNASGRNPRPITNRGGTNIDPSFTPDGRILFIGCPAAWCFDTDYEVYVTGGAGLGPATRMTTDTIPDYDPYSSPDGTRIAWLTRTSTQGRHPGGSWNIRTMAANGSNQHRLTDDDQINSKPEWARDGRTVYFHRLELPRLSGFSIFAINPDGTNLREVTVAQPGVNEFPST